MKVRLPQINGNWAFIMIPGPFIIPAGKHLSSALILNPDNFSFNSKT